MAWDSLVYFLTVKKHVEDEVTLPELTVSNETVTSSPAESVLYAHRYHLCGHQNFMARSCIVASTSTPSTRRLLDRRGAFTG